MGSIDKYCPHCGSEDIFTSRETFFEHENDDPDGDIIGKVISEWFECQVCHHAWEKHA